MAQRLKWIRWFGLSVFAVIFIDSFFLPYIRYKDMLSSLLASGDSFGGISAVGLISRSKYLGGWLAAAGVGMFVFSLGACLLLSLSLLPSVLNRLSKVRDLSAVGLAVFSMTIHVVLLFWIAGLKERGLLGFLAGTLGVAPGYGCYLNLCLLFVGVILSVCLFALSSKTSVLQSEKYVGNNRVFNASPTPESGSVIIGKTGMYRYATFRIQNSEELIIGRDAAFSHIIVDTDAEKVSRKHCSIVYDGLNHKYFVTDYSSNGTHTEDGMKLSPKVSTSLSRGTTIYLGNRQNSFLLN